jgi:hypothetical protein
MSDYKSEALMDEDIDLVIQYLNEQLDADRAADVRARLEHDPDFVRLAAPLLLAWDAMRTGRPSTPAETERRWERFTRAADFEHHRKRRITRRNWIMSIIVAAIALPGFWFRGEIRAQYRDWRDYAVVRPDTGWVTVRDHIRVRVEPNARFRKAGKAGDVQRTKLDDGVVHVQVDPIDTTNLMGPVLPIIIRTRGGEVVSAYGNFTVTVHEDTTFVEEHDPVRARYVGFMPYASLTMVGTNDTARPVHVATGKRYRLVRGSPPVLVP